MHKSMLFGTILIAISVMGRVGIAQTEESSAQIAGQAASQAAAQTTAPAVAPKSNQATVAANSKINAVLESSIDSRNANPGDELSAKVAKDVKHNGEVVIHKGDQLLGKVVSTDTKGSTNSGSQRAVQFDRLKSGETTTELQTVVTTVLSSSAAFGEEPTGMGAPAPMAMPDPQASGGRASGGGLLGGVGSTVGSTLGAACSIGSTAGGVLDTSTSSTLGASGGLAHAPAGLGVRVESQHSTSESASMNSVFSSPQDNFRLDSGTNLQFRVVGRADSSTTTQPD